MTRRHAVPLPRPLGVHAAALLSMKAALSALFQRRRGARAPARVLYYDAHSLLRALRRHVSATTPARDAA